MLNFIKSQKNFIFLTALFFIAVVSHLEWFRLDSILIKGDWGYWFTDYVAKTPGFYGTWIAHQGFGVPNIQIYFNIFFYPVYVLSSLGLTAQAAYKITLFIPIAVFGFVAPFYLTKKITNDAYIAFICSLFYGSNTYFLSIQTGHLPIAFVYSIAPFIMISFMSALERNTVKNWIFFSIIYSVGVGYELRIMYILSFVLLFYFLFFYFGKIKKYILHFILTGIIIILLNIYWLLPTLLGGIGGSIGEVANRGLFGGSLTDIVRSFTVSQWSWTGGSPNREFDAQPIIFYFWLVSIFIFLVLSFKKTKYLPQIVFYLVLLLIGILLAKQSSPPFENLYKFLYEYFPGFNLFRESSKFYLILAISYTGLLGYVLLIIKKSYTKLFFVISILLLSSFLFTLKPLITKEYQTLFVNREMSTDYSRLADHIRSDDSDYRVLWVPRNSQWAYFSMNNPRVSMMGAIGREWKEYTESGVEMTGGEVAISFLNNQFADNIMDAFSVRYVVVPMSDKNGLEQKLFANYQEDRSSYISVLDKLSFLNKIDLGMDNLSVYENSNYRPLLYITSGIENVEAIGPFMSVDYVRNSPTEAKVKITNLSGPVYLNFSESYHPNWEVRLGDFNRFNVLFDNNYFISKKNHIKNDFGLNSFLLDPDQICNSSLCHKNENGKYDINLTIYFKTQSYLYIGTVISALCLVIIIGYLGFMYFRRNEKK